MTRTPPRFRFTLDDDATPDAAEAGDQLPEANYRAAILARETGATVTVTDRTTGDSWTIDPEEARVITEAAQDEDCPCEFHRAMRAAEQTPHADAPSVPTLAEMAAFLSRLSEPQTEPVDAGSWTAPDLADVMRRASYVAPLDTTTRH